MPENRQVFISKREAGEIFREKRFVFADNLETECIEDKCSQRELEECFDFETGLVKVGFQCFLILPLLRIVPNQQKNIKMLNSVGFSLAR